MPNVATILKQEISRIARKESKAFFKAVPGALKSLRRTVSAQIKRIAQLEAKIKRLERRTGDDKGIALPKPEELEKSRLGAGNIAKLRKKLDLTRAEMAKLIGVNPNSIFLWENGKATPRAAAKAKVIALRSLGKREIKKLLAGLSVTKEEKSSPEVKSTAPKRRKPRTAKTATEPKKDEKAASDKVNETAPAQEVKPTTAGKKARKPKAKTEKTVTKKAAVKKAPKAKAALAPAQAEAEKPASEPSTQPEETK